MTARTYEVEVVTVTVKTYTVEAPTAAEARARFATPSVWSSGLIRQTVRSVRRVRA